MVAAPSDFICPITMEIMVHPVMTRYGHCFDRSAIMTWICSSDESQCECPLTRKPLRISDIINNHSLGERIKAWCKANSYPIKQNVTPTSDDSSCDDDDDDIATHFFVSADFNKTKESTNTRAFTGSQSSRNSTNASATTLPRKKHNLLRMAVFWTQRK